MNTRKILTLLVVVGLIVPAATAATTAQTDSSPNQAQPQAASGGGSDGGTATTSGGSASGGSASDAGSDANYTRLYIDDRHQHLELKPGETESFTVTVENGEDEPVDVSPRVHIPPRGERPIEKSWVTLEDGNTTLDAGEEREFEVTVSIPEGTELNQYGGVIAFTDETVSYPGRPARPVHGVSLHVEVWKEPTVRILSDRHTYTQVKAGDTFTREIVIENTGDQAVPVNPQLNTEQRHQRHYPPGEQETLDRSWLEIDAPNEIDPGETATVEVTVSPPADAERGDYRAQLDLGLKDPARPDDRSYWQQIDLGFQVWTQPDEPFETSFEVSEDAEQVDLELSAGRPHHGTSEMESPSFDVTFVSPDGEEIDAERIRVTNRGSVSLGGDRRQPVADDSTYSTGGEQQTFRYRVEDPESGSWSVRIMPESTMHFGYEIIRDEQ